MDLNAKVLLVLILFIYIGSNLRTIHLSLKDRTHKSTNDISDISLISSLPLPKSQDHDDDDGIRVMMGDTCTGSSAAIRYTIDILEAHGYDVNFGGELTKISAKGDPQATIDTLKEMRQTSADQDKILIIKAMTYTHDVILTALKDEMDGRFSFEYRNNDIDITICRVRDCFLLKKTLGYQVYANGTKSDLCFARRKSSEKVMAYFDDLPGIIRYMQRQRTKQYNSIVKHRDTLISPAKIQSYEDLFFFQYSDNEEDFQYSLSVWCEFVRNMVPVVKKKLIEKVLRAHQNSKAPLLPHNELIYNYNDFEKAIKKKWPSLLKDEDGIRNPKE